MSQTVSERTHRTLWWKEALIVAVFYGVYSLVRNQFGSALVSGSQIPVEAFLNAMRVIRIERAIGLYHEMLDLLFAHTTHCWGVCVLYCFTCHY
ncbi:MAG: hypothetical protein ACKO97_06715 [Actinomycetota bacterium]